MFPYIDMDLFPLYKLSIKNVLIFPNKLNLTINFLLRKLFLENLNQTISLAETEWNCFIEISTEKFLQEKIDL